MTLMFLDTETLGLDLMLHDVWEIAFAVEDGLIESSIVTHNLIQNEPQATEINRYFDRGGPIFPAQNGLNFETRLISLLHSERYTIVGANPEFDKYRLSRRWAWQTPWNYRSIDVETYVMPMLGLREPIGLNRTVERMNQLGHGVAEPDHTAAGDVESVRDVFRAAQDFYVGQNLVMSTLS